MTGTKWLFQPLDKIVVNQVFGDNRACVNNKNSADVITCNGLYPPKGYRSLYSKMKGHNGLDLNAYRGQPIYASQDGVVTEYVAEDSRGLGIGIQTKRRHWCQETGKNEYFKIRYWHNLVNLVKKGDEVRLGQIIALADNTGYSSGDHLHLEAKPVSKQGRNLLQRNGFFGAVDPQQYMLPVRSSIFNKSRTLKDRALVAFLMWMNRL
jgi:murein DD-endopeptidase MepM/ murein hydrolase activator NlpD